MAKVISVGIQKGGCGKTTTASILAYSLSQEYKVLAVDMDGQGNMTQLLTGVDDIFELDEHTVSNAIIEEDATNHILEITSNLHILCGTETVNTLAPHFHKELDGNYHFALRNALYHVREEYDYIVIDNPPALGELSIISLAASDSVLIMYEPSKFCHSSLQSYMKTIEVVKDRLNPKLEIKGIIRTLIDTRRSDNKYYSKKVEEEYGDLCLKTILKRTAVVGRLSSYGFIDSPEIKKVMKEYRPLIRELMGNEI